MCLGVYYIISGYQRPATPEEETLLERGEREALKVNLHGWKNLYLWIPALCDLTGTTLMNVGLIYTSASIYQMLRGSVVLFTGTLSHFVLKTKHPLYKWAALIVVFIGVLLVGAAGIMSSSSSTVTTGSPLEIVGISIVVITRILLI